MKQSRDSKAWSQCLSKLVLIFTAMLLMTQTVLGQNANVSFNFNNPGQYDHIPTNYFNGTNDWLTPVNAGVPNGVGNTPPLFESVEGGTGSLRGSGAIDLHTGNLDVTTVLQPITWDFSQAGTTLKASIMVKLRHGPVPTANNRATQIGFVTATNVVQPGINAVTNQAFMTVILQSTAQPAYTYQLRYQTKVAASVTATEVTPAAGGPETAAGLTPGNWYKLEATFVNASPTTLTIAATLTDMGADGLTPGVVVGTLAPSAPITLADLAGNNKIYLAIRRTDENTAIDYWDDIMVQSVSGATGVLPLPATTDVPHGGVTQIFAKATGDGPFTYQWNKNGSPLAGQTNWKLVIGSAVNSDAGSYTVTVTGKDGNAVTSSATTLNVTANPLALVSVGSVDGGSVGVLFNQNIDRPTGLSSANYSINGSAPKGVTVNGRKVILVPASPLAGNYTVTVQNVKDRSGTAIAAGASANGRVEGFTGVDINNSGQKGYEYSFAPGQFEVFAGGSDIWNAADQFRFVYKQRTGDFDVAMKIPYADVNRTPFKAGFNVRDSLAGQAIEVGASVNPPFPGRNFAEGVVRQNYNVAAAAWGASTVFIPVNGNIGYPNVWLRFRRTGQTFTRYTSADGVTWRFDGQQNVPLMPQTVYFGIGVCSVAQGEIGRAVFEFYQDLVPTPGATITVTTQPPAALAVNAGGTAAIALAATWSGSLSNELQVVWQRFSGTTWTNIPSAPAGGAFTTPALYIGDNGAQYRAILVAPGATSVTSDVTTVTVTDTGAPTATASLPANSLYTILVTFNEPVDPATALNKANYTIVNAASTALTITDAKFATQDQRVVALTVSTPLPAGDYFASVAGVKDLGNNLMTPLVSAKVTQAATPPTQVVVVEMYNRITGANQGALANFEASGKYQFHIPDFIFYQNVFGFNSASTGFADTGWNDFGARVFSYFVPPTTGNYKFYMGVDDVAVLYFNPTGIDPGGAVELGRSPDAFVNANYILMTAFSTNIALTAGQKYYLEARFKEGGGGDGVRVQAVLSSNNTVPPTSDTGIPASQLAFPSDVALRTPVVSELYTGITGAGLAELDSGAATANFVNRAPNITTYQKDFAANRAVDDSSRNDYLGRLFSYFVPPADGLYRLWFRSDDASRIYMNTNEVDSINPAGAKLLGSQGTWNASYISQIQNIPLKGGQKYYLEGRWKEGGGGDGLTVVFKPQDDSTVPVGGGDATAVEVQSGDNFEFPYEIFTSLGPVTVGQIAPSNPTVAEGQRITFSIPTPGGAGPFTTTWYKNGQQIYFGANSFTTEPLTQADSGSVWTVVVSNNMGYQVRSTTLTVNADSTKPALFAATGSYLDVVRLDFSEALDRASAMKFANYSFSPNLGIWRISFDEANGNTVLLHVTPLTPNQLYQVSVSGVKDFAGNEIAVTSKSFSGWAYGGQGLLVEYFDGQGGTAVAQDLWGNSTRFKVNNPAASGYIPFFGFGTETQVLNNFLGGTRNNFGVRIVGLYRPLTDGYYRLAMRGDDETRLFMNTNGPSHMGKVQVARNVGANSGNYLSGSGDSQGTSATAPLYGANSYTPLMFLRADTEYYVEGYMKEGGGGDYIAVVQYETTDPANDNPRDTPNHAAAGIPINDVTQMIPGSQFRAPANPDLGPVTFLAQPPATLTLGENSVLNLTVNAQGVPAAWLPIVKYQWQRFNTATSQYENIDGATGTNYSKFVTAADAGQYRVIVSIPTADRVFNTTLTVSNDTTPPTVVSAAATNRFDRVYVRFSEPVVAATFAPSHFAISGGVTVTAVNQIDATTAELVTSQMLQYTDYTVTINNIVDLAGLNTASVQKTIKTWNLSKGFWRVEFWDNVDATIGVNVTAFLSSPAYAGAPSSSMVVSGPFTTRTYQPNDARAEQYGARMTALFTPPSDGDYHFFTGADDQIVLQISTDDKPENLGPIIASDTAGCCQGFQEPGVPETTATPITLVGGKPYLLQVVFKEGGGGDWAQVAFRKVGDTTPAGSLQPILAQYLSIYGDPATPLDITLQPQSQSVLENRSVTLTMSASSTLAVGVQWQVDTGTGFTDIAGATGSSYTTPLLQLNQTGIKYRAVVCGFGNT